MEFVVLEDDRAYANDVRRALSEEFPSVRITLVASSEEFRKTCADFLVNPPDLFIIDVMLCEGRIVKGATNSAGRTGRIRFRAGIEALEWLLSKRETADVPVIVHSVVTIQQLAKELERAPAHVVFAEKSGAMQPLLLAVKSLVPDAPAKQSDPQSLLGAIADASEVKLGGLGVRVDVKAVVKSRRRAGRGG